MELNKIHYLKDISYNDFKLLQLVKMNKNVKIDLKN